MDELRKIYYEEFEQVVKAQKGNIDSLLLESVDEKGTTISFSSWESKEEHDAFATSDTWAEMVNKVKHMFAEPPTVKFYEIKK